MATIEELIARVREVPEDDAPRLVLADALIERGDPWGEILSLSLQWSDDPDVVARYDELYLGRWGKLEGFVDRGFFDELRVDDTTAPRVTRGSEFGWVRELAAEVSDAGLAALVGAPIIAGADELTLVSAEQQPLRSIENVLACVATARCHALMLRRIRFEHADLVALMALPPVRALKRLEISGHPWLAGRLEGLDWPALESLELSLGVTSDDLAAVLRCPALHGLRALEIGYNPIDDMGMRALVRTPFTRLTKLEIASLDITDDGLEMLTAAPHLLGLTSLAIGVTSGPLVHALPRLAEFTQLTELELDTETEPAALAALYEALVAPLERLTVRVRQVPPGVAVPPLDRPAFRALQRLDLSSQPLSEAAVQRLAGADLPQLAHLNLSGCKISPAGTASLIGSSLPRDLSLSFRGNTIGPHEAELRARFAHVWL